MVEVRDVTEEKQIQKNRVELEKKLAEECFSGKKIEVIGTLMYIDNGVACKYFGNILMYVKDKSVELQAQEFGRRYEEQFNIKNFIIETDYS